jgi:hypothetical protein
MTFCPIFHGTPEDLSRIYPITYKIGADLTQHFERIGINSRLGVIYKLIQQDGVRTGEDVPNVPNVPNVPPNRRIKKGYLIEIPFSIITNLPNYFTSVVGASAGISAVVESVAVTAVESTTTAVESVVASVVPLPPQATIVVAIAKIAITFFILLFLFV